MSTQPHSHDAVVQLAAAFLAMRRFGLEFTSTIDTDVGPEYRENATIAVLAGIVELGPIRLRDLIAVIAVPGPTASRVVDRLVERGDVVRQSGSVDGDRRAVTMSATTAGRRRLEQIDNALLADADRIGVHIKEAIVHLERGASGVPVAMTAPDRSLVGRLTHFGILCGDALRSMSPSGDTTEALALFALAETGEGRPRTVADRVGLTSGGTTKLLDRLEEQGLIERTFGLADDRRGVAVHLTDRGRQQLAEMAARAESFRPLALESLTELADRIDR